METFEKKTHTHTDTHRALHYSTPLHSSYENKIKTKKNSQESQAKQKGTKIQRRDRDRGE
jgi:hypothetical protein